MLGSKNQDRCTGTDLRQEFIISPVDPTLPFELVMQRVEHRLKLIPDIQIIRKDADTRVIVVRAPQAISSRMQSFLGDDFTAEFNSTLSLM